MRIVNKHYAQLLVGYDRVMESSQKFEETWSDKSLALEKSYQQKLSEYNQRFIQWEKTKKSAEDRYDQVYQAWYISETPNREIYERNLVLWKKRWTQIVQRNETKLKSMRSSQKTYLILFVVCLLLSCLVVPIIPAIIFGILYFRKRKETRSLTYRRNYIHALPEPAYKPLTPAPQKPVISSAPTRPSKVKLPVMKGMLDFWWESLQTTPPDVQNVEQIKEGDEGEALLVQALNRVLSDDFIVIPGAMVESGTDADVVVISKNGIWVLDSKYYAGTVRYTPREGWSQEKSIYIKGGRGAQEVISKEVSSLSDEWQREKNSVEFTLKKRMRSPHPPIIGGIAFTYNASLDIVDCPVAFGSASFWSKQIASIPCDPKFSERDLVECAHHILNFSHTLINDNTASALDKANELKASYYAKAQTIFGKE